MVLSYKKSTGTTFYFWLIIMKEITKPPIGIDQSIKTSLWVRRPWFDFRRGRWWDLLLYATASRPVVGPTHPPTHWVMGEGSFFWE